MKATIGIKANLELDRVELLRLNHMLDNVTRITYDEGSDHSMSLKRIDDGLKELISKTLMNVDTMESQGG